MPNAFYQPGRDRAARVQDLFGAIAGRYDLINDLQSFGLHRFWKRRLLTLAQAGSGDRVLDLCCGTGDVALRFAGTGAAVVGVDFSRPMLAVAASRSQKLSREVLWVNGDALQLPFPDAAFQIVTVSYGLRNLADVEAGLREMLRVTLPGGRLLVLDFGKPRRAWLRAAYFAYLKHWVPLFGRVLCGDAATYGYILESLRHYPAQEGVAVMMRELGCRQVQVRNLLGGMMSINYAEKGEASTGTGAPSGARVFR
jgi:demethylmenaquinone methyltransferase/2-methoxy-6-polyprenyl-1,4-benzoquinol methylase